MLNREYRDIDNNSFEKLTKKEKYLYKGIVLFAIFTPIIFWMSGIERTNRFPLTMIICLVLTFLFKDLCLLRKCIYFDRSILKYLILPLLLLLVFLSPSLLFLEEYQSANIDFGEFIYDNIAIAVEEEYISTFLYSISILSIMKYSKKFNEYNKGTLVKSALLLGAIFSLLHARGRITIYYSLINNMYVDNTIAVLLSIGSLIPIFFFGFYAKVLFLKTHNLLLVMFIHFSWNLCLKLSAWETLISHYIFIIVQVIVTLGMFIYGIVLSRREWGIEFWNENI
jgi:hypothetical protein